MLRPLPKIISLIEDYAGTWNAILELGTRNYKTIYVIALFFSHACMYAYTHTYIYLYVHIHTLRVYRYICAV